MQTHCKLEGGVWKEELSNLTPDRDGVEGFVVVEAAGISTNSGLELSVGQWLKMC
jgi:hypothetical protein